MRGAAHGSVTRPLGGRACWREQSSRGDWALNSEKLGVPEWEAREP